MRRSAVPGPVLTVIAIAYWDYAQYVIACMVSHYILRILLKLYRFMGRHITNHQLKDVDEMDGLEFEEYVADVLRPTGIFGRNAYGTIWLRRRYYLDQRRGTLGCASETLLWLSGG